MVAAMHEHGAVRCQEAAVDQRRLLAGCECSVRRFRCHIADRWHAPSTAALEHADRQIVLSLSVFCRPSPCRRERSKRAATCRRLPGGWSRPGISRPAPSPPGPAARRLFLPARSATAADRRPVGVRRGRAVADGSRRLSSQLQRSHRVRREGQRQRTTAAEAHRLCGDRHPCRVFPVVVVGDGR
jgi:hypothetical protein